MSAPNLQRLLTNGPGQQVIAGGISATRAVEATREIAIARLSTPCFSP